MSSIETSAYVGADGLLSVRLPAEYANSAVVVVVRSVGTEEPPKRIADIKDPEERRRAWLKFIDETAGSIQDPTFERPDQGTFEEREQWE